MPTAQLLFNTIALDPNRWTAGRTPYYRLSELLPGIAGAGFRGLEVWAGHAAGLRPAEADALRQYARSLDLTFPVLGLYPVLHEEGPAREAELRRVEHMLQTADSLGASLVKLFAGSLGSDAVDEPAYARSVTFVQAMAEEAARRGLRLTLETHPDTLCDTVVACERFLDDVDRPNVQVCFQPFDFQDTDAAVADYEALADHVVHLHLQGRVDDQMSLLEEADLDYRPLVEALRTHDFTGYACIEFVKDCAVADPARFDLARVLAHARRDRAYVQTLCEDAGLPLTV